MNANRRPQSQSRSQSIVEYGILLSTLALGVVLTLVAIGTQVRTVMTDSPKHHGEP